MTEDMLYVGQVVEFYVRHGIVHIIFAVKIIKPDSAFTKRIRIMFDDRLHLLKMCRGNRFYTHGIAGLGSVLLTIVNKNQTHELVPDEIPRLSTGWSYQLSIADESDTPDRPTHLKPVN